MDDTEPNTGPPHDGDPAQGDPITTGTQLGQNSGQTPMDDTGAQHPLPPMAPNMPSTVPNQPPPPMFAETPPAIETPHVPMPDMTDDPEPTPPPIRFEHGTVHDLMDHIKEWFHWRIRQGPAPSPNEPDAGEPTA